MDQEGALGVKIFLGFIAALGILALPASSANAALPPTLLARADEVIE